MMTKEREFEALRMFNVRSKMFWAGVAASEERTGYVPPSNSISGTELKNRARKWRLDVASKGGRALKADPLTLAIRKIVVGRPDITEIALRKALYSMTDFAFLDAKDLRANTLRSATQIQYYSISGKEKVAPLSGLKDRLSREKKIRANQLARLGAHNLSP